MGAVKEQKPKRCLSSQESFSAFSFLLHWLSLPLQALSRKGASSGYSAIPPARQPALLQPPAAPLEDSSGAQPWPALRSSRSSQPTLLVGLSNQPKLLLLLLRNLRRGVSSGCSATPPARLPALLQPPAAPLEDSSGEPHCPVPRSSPFLPPIRDKMINFALRQTDNRGILTQSICS